MALVGDVIMGFRELATDLPQTLGPPVINSVSSSAGSNLGAGTYFFVATQVNTFGETIASNEVTIVLATAANVTLNLTYSGQIATAVRIYLSTTGTGNENIYYQFPLTGSPVNFTIPNTPTGMQSPPSRSTVYLPDTDGQAVGAFAAYRWLNEGLRAAANFSGGGVPDFGAVGTVNSQPLYNLIGYWKKLDSAWYDGYPVWLMRKNDVFRKAPVPGTVAGIIVYQASDRLIIETWPQPARTSGQTTLASPMGTTDTTATLTSASLFVLGFGMVQIGSEVMEYSSISGNTLNGLTRGMCGTVPAAQAAGVAVTELNLMISGFRVPSTYSVGSSLATLNLPPGWEDAIKDYMLGRYREAEQESADASRLLKQFNEKMQSMRANRIIAGPRQISITAGRGAETYPGLGGVFGGVIVP